jgi:hypothetical protein
MGRTGGAITDVLTCADRVDQDSLAAHRSGGLVALSVCAALLHAAACRVALLAR